MIIRRFTALTAFALTALLLLNSAATSTAAQGRGKGRGGGGNQGRSNRSIAGPEVNRGGSNAAGRSNGRGERIFDRTRDGGDDHRRANVFRSNGNRNPTFDVPRRVRRGRNLTPGIPRGRGVARGRNRHPGIPRGPVRHR